MQNKAHQNQNCQNAHNCHTRSSTPVVQKYGTKGVTAHICQLGPPNRSAIRKTFGDWRSVKLLKEKWQFQITKTCGWYMKCYSMGWLTELWFYVSIDTK